MFQNKNITLHLLQRKVNISKIHLHLILMARCSDNYTLLKDSNLQLSSNRFNIAYA